MRRGCRAGRGSGRGHAASAPGSRRARAPRASAPRWRAGRAGRAGGRRSGRSRPQGARGPVVRMDVRGRREMSSFGGMRHHGVRRRPLHLPIVALPVAPAAAPLAAAATGAAAAPAAAAAGRAADQVRSGTLPLGAADLREVRTTRVLQRGVTMTRIVRGGVDPADVWTVNVSVPRGATSPDPDAAPTPLSGRPRANALAQQLTESGFAARVEDVTTPAVADFAGGHLGYRVRVGAFPSRRQADAQAAQLRAAGFSGATTYTGWDGRADDRGPWRAWVLTIDPRTFRGRLASTYGADLLHRERTSTMARRTNARAAVNGGFFVLDPAAGAPGDPAGIGVYGGSVRSEAVNGRPGFVVDQRGGSRVTRIVWHGSVRGAGGSLRLDGVDRVPGKIRSCGGVGGDQPTLAPLQDITCTDPSEAVAFTAAYGRRTPSGAGAEAVVDRHGLVKRVRAHRGGTIPKGGSTVQATGDLVGQLRAVAVRGSRLTVRSTLATRTGRPVRLSARTGVVNAGPVLVRAGRVEVSARRDGFVRSSAFYYAFAARRNPRTLAGTDRLGRTVLVVVDG